jgi:hypothetical protein
VSGTQDLVTNCFTGLTSLYFENQTGDSSTYFTDEIALGLVLSSGENEDGICGYLLPVKLLKFLCNHSFTLEVVQVINVLRLAFSSFNIIFVFEELSKDLCLLISVADNLGDNLFFR